MSRWFFSLVISLFTLTLMGFPKPFAETVAAESTLPVIRHLPMTPLTVGENHFVYAVVEDESPIVSITLFYRAMGQSQYQMTPMGQDGGNQYKAAIPLSQDSLKVKGIEYYMKGVDHFGNEGFDGTQAIPYFIEVRKKVRVSGPVYKNKWFWMGVFLGAVGGGYSWHEEYEGLKGPNPQ
jgi:hypothetical protein